MKVYLLNNGGSYSDYGVLAIFSDEQEAKKARARVGGEIEVYTLYDKCPPRHTTYVIERDTRTNPSAEIREYQMVQEDWDGVGHFNGHMVRGVGIGNYGSTFYRRWGLNKEQVHRSFHDYDAEMRAKSEGIA